MGMWRRHMRLKRLTVALAAAALAVPTVAQARVATEFDSNASQAIVQAQDKLDLGLVTRTADRPFDGAEYLRATPRTADRPFDGAEYLRATPRTAANVLDGAEYLRVGPREGAEYVRVVAPKASSETVSAPGFDWGDAGIGAGIMAAFVLAGLGAAVRIRHVKTVAA
jgi:hypothetical protein